MPRDFALYQSARFFVTLAIQIQSVSIGWLMYDLTHRPLSLGLVGLAQFVPVFALALVTGQVADRYDRHRILAICYGLLGVFAGGMFLFVRSGSSSTWPIYALLVLFGATRAFTASAGAAFVTNLVPPELLSRALALSSGVWQVATVLGPTLGALVFTKGGPTAAFGLSLVCFVIAWIAIALVRTRSSGGPARGARWADALEGLRYIRENKLLLSVISLDLFAVLLGGATALLPVFAKDILHNPSWLGWLRSAPSVGASLMAIVLAYAPIQRRAGVTLLGFVALFGIATIAFGLSTNLYFSLACLFVLGAADMVSVVIRQTLTQGATPDAKRGRVSAVNQVFIGASNELGELESGLTAEWLGAVRAVVIGGIGTCLVVVTWAAAFPSLRRTDRLEVRS